MTGTAEGLDMAFGMPDNQGDFNRAFDREMVRRAPSWNGPSGMPGKDPGGTVSIALFLTLVLAPFALVLFAAFALARWFAQHMPAYRSVLEGVLPEGWITLTSDAPGRPFAAALVVAGVALAAVVGLTILRMAYTRSWAARHDSRRAPLVLICLALSTLRTVVLVAGIVLVLGALVIASGSDLGMTASDDPVGAGRWAVAGAGVALWSLWFTYRAVTRAYRRKHAGWSQSDARHAGTGTGASGPT